MMRVLKHGWMVAAAAAAATAAEFPLIGRVRPRSAAEIAGSSWSVGCETLDRDFAVYSNYKAWLGPLGAKRIRVQTGWQKCEKAPGVYDFAWLDDVVNDALAQGVQPWLQTNYGNTNYPGGGGTGLGGGIPSSPEALAGWDGFVRALVRHFKDRVREWEIWNEPDLGKDAPVEAFADLHIRTAEMIRSEQPGAKIWALGLAGKVDYAEAFLKRLQQAGKTGLVDAITFHGYPANPDDTSLADRIRALLAICAPHAVAIQGETGAPSTSDTFGALRNRPWSEVTQAKWNLRRMLAHYAKDIPHNQFTLMELKYPSGWNTKGLLRANEDMTVARPKPAYHAAQHVYAIYDDAMRRLPGHPLDCDTPRPVAAVAARHGPSGRDVVALWFSGAPPRDDNDATPVDVRLPAARIVDPVLVDLRTGDVRAIPPDRATREGEGWAFRGVPLYDAPILIADRAAIPIEPSPRSAAAALDAHRARWRRPEVEARIGDGIRRHRQGRATLRVTGPDGAPLAGATLAIRQTSHAFLFGCNAFVLGQLGTPDANRRYEQTFLRLFNFATVPFYWEGTEPTPGELRYEEPAREIWRRPPPSRFLPWAATNGITLKGHPLLWHAYNPPWLPSDAEELRARYRTRFDEIAQRFAAAIPTWDVVNESLVCPAAWPLFTPDRAYVEWAFREAARRWPADAVLMINEVTKHGLPAAGTNAYFEQVRGLLARGVPIRGIGIQFHFFRRPALDAFLAGSADDPMALLDLYEMFATLDRPLYITEITIPSAEFDGEAVQAEIVRDVYRLWFAAPRMRGITWWNLGDGTAVKNENAAMGGLVDDRLQPKSAYRILDRLIHEEWRTSLTAATDAAGRTNVQGFHGRYEVEATVNGRPLAGSFELPIGVPPDRPIEVRLSPAGGGNNDRRR